MDTLFGEKCWWILSHSKSLQKKKRPRTRSQVAIFFLSTLSNWTLEIEDPLRKRSDGRFAVSSYTCSCQNGNLGCSSIVQSKKWRSLLVRSSVDGIEELFKVLQVYPVKFDRQTPQKWYTDLGCYLLYINWPSYLYHHQTMVGCPWHTRVSVVSLSSWMLSGSLPWDKIFSRTGSEVK